MTTHELARLLLEMPDWPVDFVFDGQVMEAPEVVQSFVAKEVSIFCEVKH